MAGAWIYTAIGSTARALWGAPVRVGLAALNRSDFTLVANKEIQTIEQIKGNWSAATRRRNSERDLYRNVGRRFSHDEYKIINSELRARRRS
jgi:hypothetical protein